jgi:hypothetical protein
MKRKSSGSCQRNSYTAKGVVMLERYRLTITFVVRVLVVLIAWAIIVAVVPEFSTKEKMDVLAAAAFIAICTWLAELFWEMFK